jgi:anti-sigma factor RsiW
MKPEMDHERCSELLLSFVEGGLDAAVQTDVEDHLAVCPDCSSELAALTALAALAEPSPLTDLERAGLHRAVHSRAAESEVRSVPRARRSWGARLYPALGAAAALILIGSFFLFNDNEDSAPRAGADSGTRILEAPAEGSAGSVADSAAAPEAPAAVWAGEIGAITDRQLQKLGKSSFASGLSQRSSAMAVESSDDQTATQGAAAEGGAAKESPEASGSGAAFSHDSALKAVFDLESQAPPKFGSQIEDCVDKVVSGFTDRTIVPVYASAATYSGDKVLVLGFLFQAKADSGLDRYSIWAFPVGSCDIPVQALFGNA